MSKEMKMSDYFKSTNKAMAIRAIYFSCREDNQPQSTEVSERKQKTLEAAAFAVETHDRLVEENKLFRDDRNAAVAQMSKSWQHNHESQSDLLARYVSMAESQFEAKDAEIELLTAIATKHATLNDERYELLLKQKSDIEMMLDQLFKHENVDAWLVCKMNDMLDDVNYQLDKSRKEAEGKL